MMSDAEFFAGITGSGNDLALAAGALAASGQLFCLIGGLAVNYYAEPMVTLDADFAISSDAAIAETFRTAGFTVEAFPHSLNAALPGSRLRIQITVNSRYGDFPKRAIVGTVFGVSMPIACLPDLVQGKLWAATDPARRKTKRLKDRLDLARLAEAHPEVLILIPTGLIPEVDEMRPIS